MLLIPMCILTDNIVPRSHASLAIQICLLERTLYNNEVQGFLCLCIEHGVSWFASKERMKEELEQPTDRAIFFWTFLDQAIRVIERARLRAHDL